MYVLVHLMVLDLMFDGLKAIKLRNRKLSANQLSRLIKILAKAPI